MEEDIALFYYIGKTGVLYDELFDEIKKKLKKTKLPFNIRLKGLVFNIKNNLFYYNCFVNDKNYCIYKTSRLIHFKGENSRTVWISNIEQLEKELKNGFNNGYFYDGEKKAYFKVANKIGTFLNSSCCLITNVFLDDKDLQIEFDKVWENKNNFNINSTIEIYEDFYLKNDESFQFFVDNKRNEFLSEIYNFYHLKTSNNIYCITGPSGIGKSVSLLSFWNSHNNISSAYYNYKTLKLYKNRFSELLKILCFESIKLYDDYSKYMEIVKIIRASSYEENIWNTIYDIINYLKEDNKTHLIIIAQFYPEKNHDSQTVFNHLKEVIKGSSIKIVICSSINDTTVRQHLIHQWKQLSEYSPIEYHYYQKLIEINVPDGIPKKSFLVQCLKKFNMIPKYYIEIMNSDRTDESLNKIVTEQKFRIYRKLEIFFNNNEFKLLQLFVYVSPYFNVPISTKIFGEIIDFIPLKYFVIKQLSDSFIIEPHFPLIEEIIEENTDKLLTTYEFADIGELNQNRAVLGSLFEKAIHRRCKNTKYLFDTYIDKFIW